MCNSNCILRGLGEPVAISYEPNIKYSQVKGSLGLNLLCLQWGKEVVDTPPKGDFRLRISSRGRFPGLALNFRQRGDLSQSPFLSHLTFRGRVVAASEDHFGTLLLGRFNFQELQQDE